MYSMEDRLLERIEIDEQGCWIWQRSLHRKGYAKWKVGRPQKSVWVHRLSYETFIGKIPDGLTIDHLCEVKACINPHHLEPVTSLENIRRFQEADRQQNPNFGCGHPRFGENRKYVGTKVKGKLKPRRVKKYGCRVCNDAYMRAYLKEYLPRYKERKRNATANSLHS